MLCKLPYWRQKKLEGIKFWGNVIWTWKLCEATFSSSFLFDYLFVQVCLEGKINIKHKDKHTHKFKKKNCLNTEKRRRTNNEQANFVHSRESKGCIGIRAGRRGGRLKGTFCFAQTLHFPAPKQAKHFQAILSWKIIKRAKTQQPTRPYKLEQFFLFLETKQSKERTRSLVVHAFYERSI